MPWHTPRTGLTRWESYIHTTSKVTLFLWGESRDLDEKKMVTRGLFPRGDGDQNQLIGDSTLTSVFYKIIISVGLLQSPLTDYKLVPQIPRRYSHQGTFVQFVLPRKTAIGLEDHKAVKALGDHFCRNALCFLRKTPFYHPIPCSEIAPRRCSILPSPAKMPDVRLSIALHLPLGS